MRQQVQRPPNQEGSGSPSSNPVILRSPETRQPRPKPASPSTRKPPTSSESRTPAASRPGVAQRSPAQPRSDSGPPGSPAVATKPIMLRKLPKAQTFDQSSQPNQRKGLKSKSAPTLPKSGASSRSPNYDPNQIIIAGSRSRKNTPISRCPFRLPNNTAFSQASPLHFKLVDRVGHIMDQKGLNTNAARRRGSWGFDIFRLTREHINGIVLKIVWATNTSGG